jgi:hypothetical protein
METFQFQTTIDTFRKNGSVGTTFTGTFDQMSDLKVKPNAVRISFKEPSPGV